jgi:hypothetical protein
MDTIALVVEFPAKEFSLIPSAFSIDLSIKHRTGTDLFYLGEVESLYWETPQKVVMGLEIRKDETPAWYVRDIVKEAKIEEIVLVKGSRIVCKDGCLKGAKGLYGRLNKNAIVAVEAWIIPLPERSLKKAANR